MASDDTMTIHSSIHDEDDEEEEDNDGDEDDLHHPLYSMSRLSLCTSNSKHSISEEEEEEEEEEEDDVMLHMSRLYVESEVEADGEFSDGKDDGKEEGSIVSDDEADKETTGWYSLSERKEGGRRKGLRRRRRVRERERCLERTWEMRKGKAADEESGESECVVIARPKGGGGGGERRCLCMDIEEVKACRDLGFDLQNQWTLEIPSSSRISVDTDSGGNSPIANWRISSAGDDPRDVKARLKVWAQAVALASTSHLSG